jgi:hypothetical protein
MPNRRRVELRPGTRASRGERRNGKLAEWETQRDPQRAVPRRVSSHSGRAIVLRQGVLHLVELRVGVRADRLNGGETDDDDQGKHDGIFDGGRAIFRSQELLDDRFEIFHWWSPRSFVVDVTQ